MDQSKEKDTVNEVSQQPEKSKRLPPLLRLLRRASIFLFLTLSAFAVFYIMGNRQNFLDSNITLILNAITFNSIMLMLISAASLISTIAFSIIQKRWSILFNLFFFAITLSYSIFTLILSITVNNLSEGFNF